MSAKADQSPEKASATEFTGVGVSQRQLKPSFRDMSSQCFSVAAGFLASFLLFSVVLDIDGFNLKFPGAVFACGHPGFASCRVPREFVSRNFPFPSADADAPPVGIACARATVRGTHHRELSVGLTDAVAWL